MIKSRRDDITIKKQYIPNVSTPKGWYYFTLPELRKPGNTSSIRIPIPSGFEMKEGLRSLFLKLRTTDNYRALKVKEMTKDIFLHAGYWHVYIETH